MLGWLRDICMPLCLSFWRTDLCSHSRLGPKIKGKINGLWVTKQNDILYKITMQSEKRWIKSPSSHRDHTSVAPLPVTSWSPTIDPYALTAGLPSENTEIDSESSIVWPFEFFSTQQKVTTALTRRRFENLPREKQTSENNRSLAIVITKTITDAR